MGRFAGTTRNLLHIFFRYFSAIGSTFLSAGPAGILYRSRELVNPILLSQSNAK
jgi:hypothetical protein